MNVNVLQTCQQFFQREFNPQETMQLLKSNGWAWFSWGASRAVNLKNKGLLLKVSARRHKAYVLITLGWADLYEVRLINTKGVVMDEMTELYFDVLFDAIDKKIEWVPEYER